jgi:hypothetical protein
MTADSFDNNGTDYAVGYRRPPLHSRFQPGVSGNPPGRPKGAANLKTLMVLTIGSEPEAVKTAGRPASERWER